MVVHALEDRRWGGMSEQLAGFQAREVSPSFIY